MPVKGPDTGFKASIPCLNGVSTLNLLNTEAFCLNLHAFMLCPRAFVPTSPPPIKRALLSFYTPALTAVSHLHDIDHVSNIAVRGLVQLVHRLRVRDL